MSCLKRCSIVDLNQHLYGASGPLADLTINNLAQRRNAFISLGRTAITVLLEASEMADTTKQAISIMGVPNAYAQEIDFLKQVERLLTLTRIRMECSAAGGNISSGSLVKFVLPRPACPLRRGTQHFDCTSCNYKSNSTGEEIHRRPLKRVRLELETPHLLNEFLADEPLTKADVFPVDQPGTEAAVIDAIPLEIPPSVLWRVSLELFESWSLLQFHFESYF